MTCDEKLIKLEALIQTIGDQVLRNLNHINDLSEHVGEIHKTLIGLCGAPEDKTVN